MAFPDFDTLSQQYIYGQLSGNISAPVFDDVPQVPEGQPDDVFPYVVIGMDTAVDFDNDSFVGKNFNILLHIWSRDEGMQETKLIMGEIYNILHRVSGPQGTFTVVDNLCKFTQATIDPDRRTRHGVMQFLLTLTE